MPGRLSSVMDLQSGRRRPRWEANNTFSSAPLEWNGFLVEEMRAYTNELKDVCGMAHFIVVPVDAPQTVDFESEGNAVCKVISPGQICIVPANRRFSVRSHTEGGVVTLSVDPKFLACAAAELTGLENIELPCLIGVEDPLLHQLVLGLRAEGKDGSPAGTIGAESLATAVAVHLVRHYSGQQNEVRELRGGLTKYQLRRVIAFIQDHLTEDISLQKLAEQAKLSPFHFARMFKKSTGMAPHKYVLSCRVTRAKELLLRGNTDLADVAAQAGFCDQSHLALHFKHFYGMTPSAFVRQMEPHRKFR